jgi:hypothetical protein
MSRNIISVLMYHGHRLLDLSFSHSMAYAFASDFRNSIFFLSAGYTRCGVQPLDIIYECCVIVS